ncbi:ParB/RepB/Spo0J family partition protein [Streptomyces sp. NPDC046465]|uniref:ParB/RepB/Spo0J family partition protein n=1 Tax=Streptomyces sp. NPDC046465 TaxID=3155810 RepID=UPI0034095941
MSKSKSKKDQVPSYQSEQPTEGTPTRNDILSHYGLSGAESSAVNDEHEMLAWEEAQEAKLAAAAEAEEARRTGTRLHPSKVKLAALAHNPFNPREALTNLDENAASLKDRGQLQPLAVVTRSALLAVHPDQKTALGEAVYVVIDGNRRLAAAALAGIDSLYIYVNDDLAASAADILESALIANIHREDVEPLDQAHAIQQLLETHKQQKIVASRLGKTPAWVSQRLALLKLPPDLQEKVGGELTVKDARRIGGLPAEHQRKEAEEAVNRVKSPRKPRRPLSSPTKPSPDTAAPGLPAQQTSEDGSDPIDGSPQEQRTAGPEAPGTADTFEGDQAGQPPRLPYHDAPFMAHHMNRKMEPEIFAHCTELLMKILREQHPQKYDALLHKLALEQNAPTAD